MILILTNNCAMNRDRSVIIYNVTKKIFPENLLLNKSCVLQSLAFLNGGIKVNVTDENTAALINAKTKLV